jgi:hypothetical protein
LSRTIIPELHSGAPTGYRCSTFAWHFILKRDSFVVEYLEEQVAQQAEEVAAVNNALGAEERGDGWLDIMVRHVTSGGISVFLNNGDGTFQYFVLLTISRCRRK